MQTLEINLNEQGIDSVSEQLTKILEERNFEASRITRNRLAVEDILLIWRERLGDAKCKLEVVKRFKRETLLIRVTGNPIDPRKEAEEEENLVVYSSIFAQSGIAPEYHYSNGENRLSIDLSEKRTMNPLLKVGLVLAIAVITGLVCKQLPAGTQEAILRFVNPAFNTMLTILLALAAPIIFLNLLCGIVDIGDLKTLSKMGKTLFSRFISRTFLISALLIFGTGIFFKMSEKSEAGGLDAIEKIYLLLLDIIPENLLEPFISGNTLQIVTLAVAFGTVMLILGNRVNGLHRIVEEANSCVMKLMEIVGRYILLLTFLSIFKLTLEGIGGDANKMLIYMVICVIIELLVPMLYMLIIAIKFRVPFALVLKKMMPTYLLALSTASSIATFGTNMEACEKELGISPKTINFALPLGQVLYKIGGTVDIVLSIFAIVDIYQIDINISWLLGLFIRMCGIENWLKAA